MDQLFDFMPTPLVLGFIGGCLTLPGKLLLDFLAKGHFARKRRELRSYEAIYGSISTCEMRYSVAWKSTFLHVMNKKSKLPKAEQRRVNEDVKTTLIEELMKIHKRLKCLDDDQMEGKLVEWERNIQLRISRSQKIIEEEKTSEEEDQAVSAHSQKEILGDLKKKLRRLARYDY